MTNIASSMIIVEDTASARAALADARRHGASVALVPTMGSLHEGHLQLVDEAKRHASLVVMSVFVNPLQFGPHEDFARYPRDPDGDALKAERRGVDILFMPSAEQMYSGERRVVITPLALADRWEGASRPGHFTGVLTIVAKLFNIVQPDAAYFGQKDWQQATLVRRMVRDLDFPIDLAVVPTVRDADGLALSSRNVYLSEPERAQALGLSAALDAAHDAFVAGERDAASLTARIETVLAMYQGLAVEYIAAVEPDTLAPVARVDARTIVALAARAGATRLIDNIVLGQGLRAGSA